MNVADEEKFNFMRYCVELLENEEFGAFETLLANYKITLSRFIVDYPDALINDPLNFEGYFEYLRGELAK